MQKNLLKVALISFALTMPAMTNATVDYHNQPSAINSVINTKELDCLAKNIYFESRGETKAGQMAVAWVTLNRTKHEDFPETICKVVYQPRQFSWTSKGNRIHDKKAYSAAVELAKSMLIAYNNEMVPAPIKHITSALYFDSRAPKRAKKYARIGNHNFYAKI